MMTNELKKKVFTYMSENIASYEDAIKAYHLTKEQQEETAVLKAYESLIKAAALTELIG
jgi:hypothetical protein